MTEKVITIRSIFTYMNFNISKPLDWRVEQLEEADKRFGFILKMELETDTSYYIINNESKIIFNRKSTEDWKGFDCSPLERYIKNSDRQIEFYLPLTTEKYREIEDLRMGNHLEAHLHIEEMFLISYFMSERPGPKANASPTKAYLDQYNNQQKNLLVKYDTLKNPESKLLILQDEWTEKVIKPLGMGERFIIELPIVLPELSDIAYDDGELKKLRKNFGRTIELLRLANDEYLTKRDHNACIRDLRSAVELLHKLPHDPSKGKQYHYIKSYKEFLFEKSGTGSKEISQEIIVNIFEMIDAIYNISSKSVHEIESSSGSTFEYLPKQEDAELLLGTYSLICAWIANKFERATLKSRKSPYIDESLRRSLDWINEHTSSDERILSWWYYGSKINGYAKRDVCISSPSQIIMDILKKPFDPDLFEISKNRDAKDVAEALLTNDPRETAEIMQTQDANYIFIHKNDLSMLDEIFASSRKQSALINKSNPRESIKGSFMDKALNKEVLTGFEIVYDDDDAVIYKAT